MQVSHGWVLGIDLWPSGLHRNTLPAVLSMWCMWYILLTWQHEAETLRRDHVDLVVECLYTCRDP